MVMLHDEIQNRIKCILNIRTYASSHLKVGNGKYQTILLFYLFFLAHIVVALYELMTPSPEI